MNNRYSGVVVNKIMAPIAHRGGYLDRRFQLFSSSATSQLMDRVDCAYGKPEPD